MRRTLRLFSALVLGVSVGLVAVTSASAVIPAHYPIGRLVSVRVISSGAAHYASVSGWAFDPDAKSTPIYVSIRDNGVQRWVGRTPTLRTDINRIYHLTGRHGYTAIRFRLTTGVNRICTRQSNVGPGASDTSNCIRVTVTAPPPSTCGAPPNPWHYNFCGGSLIYNPPSNVCDYFSCINNFSNGVGYMVECNDAMYSMSGGRSGACSYHGGVWRPLYS